MHNLGYNVSYNKTYKVKALVSGNVTAASITGAVVKKGKNEVTDVATTANNVVTFDLTKHQGETLTVEVKGTINEEITKEDGTKATEEVQVSANFTLKVSSVVKSITVDGVKGGKLSQTLDTTKRYALKVTPVTDAVITATSSDPTVATVEYRNGMLEVTTLTTKEDGSTTDIKIMADGSEVTSFTLTTVSQLTNAKTNAVLKYATDQGFVFTLSGAPVADTYNIGGLYYEVTAAPDEKTASTPEKLVAKSVSTVVAVSGTSQDVIVDELFSTLTDEGKGGEYQFKVTVKLVQTKDAVAPGSVTIADTNIASRAAVFEGSFLTRNPYYTTKLSLKKGTTTVYTTQQDVKIADAVFDKAASYISLAAEDISYNGNKALKVVSSGGTGELSASATSNTAVGSHTIEVTAIDQSSTMYVAKATIKVNVVRGIENLSLSAPETIYKAGKKAATITLTPVYNDGATGKNDVPKTKKVTWSIEDGAYAVAHGVTVKNGKITVPANYILSSKLSDNQFKVKVTAADFGTNAKSATTETIAISADAIMIDQIVLAQAQAGGYKIIASADKTTLEPEQVKNAFILALKKAAPKNNIIDNDVVDDYVIEAVNCTYKSGNKNVVLDGNKISSAKPANNVKFTVTTADGGKQSKTLTINVGYANTDSKFGVQIYDQNGYELERPDSTSATFSGSNSSRFLLKVMVQNEDEDWVSVSDYSDFKVQVAGAKMVPLNTLAADVAWGYLNNTYSAYYAIVATGATATIKVTRGKTVLHQCTLTNTAYDSVYGKGGKSVKAPKITISSDIAQNKFTVGDGDRNVYATFTDLPDGFAEDSTSRMLVEIDQTAVNAKNVDAYDELLDSINYGISSFNAKGQIWLGLNDSLIPAGSYKLKFTAGKINEDNGSFTPLSKTTVYTLKINAAVKTSFKPVTSYTLSAKDGYAVLTGTGKNYSVTFNGLYNANVAGTENSFRTYFKIDDGKLAFQDDAFDENTKTLKEALLDKKCKDLAGYLKYTVKNSVTKQTVETKTVPVKVTVKEDAAKSYAFTGATVLSGISAQTQVSLTEGKGKNAKPVEIAKAVAAANDDIKVTVVPDSVDENTIGLKVDNATAAKKAYPVTIYVIPAGSAYELKATTDTLVQTYGIPVTAQITVKDIATENKKIKFNTTKATFSAYNSADGYQFVLPYSQTASFDIVGAPSVKEVKEGKVVKDDYKTMFKAVKGDNSVIVSISKSDVGKIGWSTVNNKGKVTSKVEKVTLTLGFGTGSTAPVAEDYTFDLTMPTEPDSQANYAGVLDILSKNKDEIEKIKTYIDYGDDEETIIDKLWDALYAVEAYINKLVPQSSDAEVEIVWPDDDDAIMDAYDQAGYNSDGSFTVKVRITDTVNSTDTAPVYTEREFTLTIPKYATDPADLADTVSDFFKGYEVNDNTINEANIRRDAREALKDAAAENGWDLSNIILFVNVDWDKSYVATDTEEGKIAVNYEICDIKYGNKSVEGNATIELARVEGLSDYADSLAATLTDELDNSVALYQEVAKETSAENLTYTDAKTLIKNTVEAAIQNENIVFDSWKTDKKSGEEDFAVAGSTISGTFVIRNKSLMWKNTAEVTFTLTIPAKEGVEAYEAIKAALTAEKVTNAVKAATDNDGVLAELNKLIPEEASGYILAMLDNDSITFTPIGYKEDSTIEFSLSVVKSGNPNTAVVSDKITLEKTTIAKDITKQTLDNLKGDITKEAAKDVYKSNSVTSESLRTAMSNLIADKTKFSLDYKTDKDNDGNVTKTYFEKTDATVTKPGSIKATFVITDLKPEDNDNASSEMDAITITITIPQITEQSENDAVAAVIAAVSNDGFKKTGKNYDQQGVIDAATAVVLADAYEVTEKGKFDVKTESTDTATTTTVTGDLLIKTTGEGAHIIRIVHVNLTNTIPKTPSETPETT